MDLITYQKALYDAIKAQGYSVYDYVPTDAPFPYVRLDYNQAFDNGTKTSEGYEVLQFINIFSSYKGQKEVREIAQTVIDSVKAIEGLDVSLRNLIVRQEKDIFQGTVVLKIKI